MKKVLITGGASGLGLELSLWFISNNYNLIILDKLKRSEVPEIIISKAAGYYQIDLSSLHNVKQFVSDLPDLDGYDVLVLNAYPRNFKNFVDFSNEEIIDFSNIAFVNQLVICNTILKSMVKREFGRIILIGSKSSFQGYSKGSLYCSLKMAYIGIFDSLSRELKQSGKNVTVSIIHPDSFSTIEGQKLNAYKSTVQKIITITKKILSSQESKQYYAISLKSRVMMSLQHIKNSLNFYHS